MPIGTNHRMSTLRRIIFCSFILISQLSYGEDFTKFWGLLSYFGRYEDVLYTIEPQLRLINRTKTYEQSLFNIGIGKIIIPEWQIWLGQTYINYLALNDVAEDVGNGVVNEYRIWEQVIWHRPFTDVFSSRIRLEQRRAFQSSEWATRLRWRDYWTIPLNNTISFALNNE